VTGALLALALSFSPTPPGEAEGPPPATPAARAERAAALLGSGSREDAARVVEEARSGPAAARRAALEALGALPEGAAPPGTLEAALPALGSRDPVLRAAAVRALVACWEPARRALVVAARTGFPVPRGRARDALADHARHAVEREFLATWKPEDGTFRGMYASLRARGPFAGRVLAAVALDRRMAGREVLGFGPYAWFDPLPGERDRSEVRARALDALEDAGTPEAADLLRSVLREAPAPELLSETDDDPVPAAVDDAIRSALAGLGDPWPLRAMIRASEMRSHRGYDTIVELRRRARAWATLGESSDEPEERTACFDRCIEEFDRALDILRASGIGVDGVEYYNLSCAYARRDSPGDRRRALALLSVAVRTYSVTAEWVERDGDLANLRAEPAFRGIVDNLRARERLLGGDVPK
jgi:hypothetical protein